MPIFCNSILHVCWCCACLSVRSVGLVPHYQLCQMVRCLIKDHAFWCGASLSAMPVGVVPHYRPCLLVRCLIIIHVFWCGAHFSCGASLSALPVDVVSHCRPCLLALYLTKGQACWSIATATNILLVKCRWKKDGVWYYLYSGAIISDMSADRVPLSDMPACTV